MPSSATFRATSSAGTEKIECLAALRGERNCATSGCPEPAGPRGKCALHQSSALYDRTWRRFRESFLAGHPTCSDCCDAGRVTQALEVHHVRPVEEYPELRLVTANCMALCRSCHARRTRRGE